MAVTIATAANYWISPTALSITLNALGEANRIQASVASGSAIVCYIRGIDGLGYDNGHNYRRWPLAIMPTYFSTNDEIYLYVAIPRSAAVGTDALVVFPDKKLDIYGYEVITNPDTGEETQGTQYGTDDYYYIWLQGIITSSGTGYTPREWRELMQTGTLATDEAIDSQEGTWYRWDPVSQTVTFLKEIIMEPASWFRNLIARSFTLNGTTLNGVAIKGETPTDSDDTIVTPAYLDGFGSEKYLRKDQDDSTPYSLGVGGTLRADGGIRTGEIRSNNYTGDSIGDSGYLLTADYNGHSKLTIDEIYVRMKAVFESLEVKKWTVSAGDEIRSCAANIINRTEYLDGSGEPIGYSDIRVPWLLRGIPFILSKFNGRVARKMYASIRKVRVNLTPEQLTEVRTVRCYFLANDGETEIQNWWHQHDLVRCQTMNIVNTQRNTYTGVTTHVGNVFWWRKCKGVSTEPVELEHGKKYHYIDIAYDKAAEDAQSASIYCLLGSDIPAAGDHMVQFGNTVEPGRMNLWIQMVNGGSGYDYDPNSDAPCIKGFKGIYTFDLSKCWYGGNPCKMILSPGNKYHFYGEDFRVIKEYGEVPVATNRGLWTSITPERDDYSPHGQVRKCYYYDEVSHKGCLWRCAIADGQHWTDASGNYISDPAYSALPDEQKVLCSRKPNYTTAEPSESSLDWIKTVDRGLSPVQIFRWYLASVTTVPTPPGTTGSTIPPSGWSTSAPNRPGDAENVYNLWMSIGDKDYQGLLVGEWSTPVRISGDKGTAGEDASDIEWIYTRNNTGTTPDTPPNSGKGTLGGVYKANWTAAEVAAGDDWVPDGWTDNPQGVDYNHKYEYASFRQKSKGHNQTWGDFQRPVLWSHWGTNGMDGDGVEYVFIRTKTDIAPVISGDDSYTDSNGNNYTKDEHLPKVVAGSGGSLNDIEADNSGVSTKKYECTDDPKGVDGTWKYEWVSKRTKASPNAETGVRQWEKYSGSMAQWANWSEDGATVKKIDKYFQATAQKSAPTAASSSTSGWTLNETPSDWSENKKYLWCQEKTTLTDDSVVWGKVYLDKEWAKSGDDAVTYSIQTSLDILRVTDTEFTVSIVKTVGGTSTVYSLSNMPSGLSLTTSNGSVNKSSSKVYNLSGLTAGGNVTLTLLNGSTQVAIKSLRVVEGLKGCVVRVTEWKTNTYYRNDDGASWLSGSNTAIGYIDVVWKEDSSATDGVRFYQCKAAHNNVKSTSSNGPGNTTYWESINPVAPIYTSLLIAKNAYIKFGTGNQFVITNSSNQVQAGMKGDGSIRIWAGASPSAGSFNHEGQSNDTLVESAPFRVYDDGRMYASNAEISGTVKASKYYQAKQTISIRGTYSTVDINEGIQIVEVQSESTSTNATNYVRLPDATNNAGMVVDIYLCRGIQTWGYNLANLTVIAKNGDLVDLYTWLSQTGYPTLSTGQHVKVYSNGSSWIVLEDNDPRVRNVRASSVTANEATINDLKSTDYVAFPSNLKTETFTLPDSPRDGMMIFCKGISSQLTVITRGHAIMNRNGTDNWCDANSSATIADHDSVILVFSSSARKWLYFSCE